MIKVKKIKKLKLYVSLFGLSTISGVAAIAASCAQPSENVLQTLFRPGNAFGNDINNLNLQDLTTSTLTQSAGFNAFLNNALAQILRPWYDNNADANIRSKIQNWNNSINSSYDSQLQNYRNQFRNNYQVRFQTDVLDAAGGTEASWKQNQLNQNIISDFNSLVFAKSYLNYVNPDTKQIVTRPAKNDLINPVNWGNIQFTNQSTSTPFTTNNSIQNNDQMFAQIQNYVFDQWVRQDNPNLVSRIVLTSETPSVGFNSIFNKDLVASPSASYEFQTFNPLNPNDTAKSRASSYQELVSGDGLNKYYNFENKNSNNGIDNFTVDIPSQLSNDSGGKLLMTADDMYSSFDVAFTDAYVNQYLYDTKPATGSLGANIGPEITFDPSNIMNNFIRTKPTSTDNVPASAYSDLSYLKRPVASQKLFADAINTVANGFYQNYQGLESGTNVIYDFARTKASATDNSDQFIVSRGKDGVHVMAVDGARYYLIPNGRDIGKQEAFLKFRSLYKSLNYVDTQINYDFSVPSQIQTFYGKNSNILLFKALQAGLNDSSSFINQPSFASLKTSFESIGSRIVAYVDAFDANRFTNLVATTVDNIRSKLNDRINKYVTNEKDNKAAENGIAGRLPDPAAIDGSYPSQEIYELQLLKDFDPKSTLTIPANLSQTGTRSFVLTQVQQTKAALDQAVTNLTTALNLRSDSVSQFSQNVFLASDTNSAYSLAINLAINATITSTELTNNVKLSFFNNNKKFTDFFDYKANPNGQVYGTFKPTIFNTDGDLSAVINDLPNVIRTYYAQPMWQALGDKSGFGVPDIGDPTKSLSSFNQIIDRIFANKNITGVNANYDSADAISYYTFIYTLEWLLENNLQNFKNIMQFRVPVGTPALTTWTVPFAVNATLTAANNPLQTFANNPNYLWGSSYNWQNHPNAIANGDLGNTLANPYQYTSIDGTSNRFGFNGVKLSGDTLADTNLNTPLFSGYAQSGNQGVLYPYGNSRDSVIAFVDGIESNTVLTNFVNVLATMGQVDTSSVPTSNDLAARKTAVDALLRDVTKVPETLFTRFSGYIGTNKTQDISQLQAIRSSDGTHQLPTFVTQINHQDIQNIGASGWSLNDPANNKDRLGLNLDQFLAAIVMQAMDDGTQSNAISDLISSNVNPDNSKGVIPIGDKRLLDALTTRWAKALN
ncbi:DUF3713 domain-containing protein [[Mycoplasma] testudinis]|uniref:DUF3713 domain-containing protein n=1 Tax=[Mycoplasma] testudinis TaxID=33924 RepID=UPI000487A37B|nr:DUF3713 domain-containing protein [[Mycoplasma] testudinis]